MKDGDPIFLSTVCRAPMHPYAFWCDEARENW